jgi:hypothetical protein
MPSWSVANAALLEGERQAELEDQPLLVVNEGWVSTTVEN